jgi:hypothetical protein
MIAATAVGLAWARASWEAIQMHEGAFADWSYHDLGLGGMWATTLWRTRLYDSARALVASVVYAAAAFASMWAIALVVIDRLRRPRANLARSAPRRRRLPGSQRRSDRDALRAGSPSRHALQRDRHRGSRGGSLTVAVVVLRFRRPRLTLRHLFRQPGAAGCAAASVVLMVELANGLTNVLDRFDLYRSIIKCQSHVLSWTFQFPRFPISGAAGRLVCSLGERPGLAVAGAYLALAVSGLWRRGSGSIENLSKVLAAFWLAAAFVLLCLPWW